MDRTWWEAHIAEVNRDFRGARYTTARLSEQFAVTRIEAKDFKTFGNSGAGCVAMALAGDALRVVLLGFDAQHTGGKTHWHGDHPKGMGNAGRTKQWPAKFAELATKAGASDIVNCSRETALTCFRRAALSEALA